MSFEFYARCDVVSMGLDEDGDEIHGRNGYVVAEASNGARWRHYFGDANRSHTETEVPPTVARLLERILAQGANPPASPHWNPIRPRYGSPAYSGAEEAELERRADEGSGGKFSFGGGVW